MDLTVKITPRVAAGVARRLRLAASVRSRSMSAMVNEALPSLEEIRMQLAAPAAGEPGVPADMAERTTESFPSCYVSRDMQYVDGLGELSGTPGAAAEFAQDAPGLELGVRALAGRTELCVGAVGFFLGFG